MLIGYLRTLRAHFNLVFLNGSVDIFDNDVTRIES